MTYPHWLDVTTASGVRPANPRVLSEEDVVEVVSDALFPEFVGTRGVVVRRYEKDAATLFDVRFVTGGHAGSVYPYEANELMVIPREEKEG